MPEGLFVLILVLGVPLATAIWLIVRLVSLGRQVEQLSQRVSAAEDRLLQLRHPVAASESEPAASAAAARPNLVAADKQSVPPPSPQALPPPVQPAPPAASAPQPAPPPVRSIPPQIAPLAPPEAPEPAAFSSKWFADSINWEQFMGVKLFAWIGGFALFVAVVLAVKYSFEKNLIPPEVRVAGGFLSGVGVLVGGLVLSKRNYRPLSQTLCATGILILYAVTFACRSFYHFAFFTPVVAFALMALITATAFTLAVRLNALVVAILGMLGGFLTPILLSTGQDNPLGLFGYLAILDAGLLLVATNRRWFFLTPMAAAGTLLMQLGWAGEFFQRERYFEGDKILVPLAVLAGFCLLYLLGAFLIRRRNGSERLCSASVFGLCVSALFFVGWFLTFAPLAQRPGLMFSSLLLIDAVALTTVGLDALAGAMVPLFGLGVFVLLGCWTAKSLTLELLTPALAFYFIFGALHAALPVVWQRRGRAPAGLWGAGLFPPLALALVLVPILKLAEVSFVVWPFVLLVDLLAIVLAALSACLWPVLAVIVLTLVAIGSLIFKIPVTLEGLPFSFSLLAVFSVLFVGVSVWMARKFRPLAKPDAGDGASEQLASQLPAMAAALPFALLVLAALKLPLSNPSPLFAVALLLVVLLLGLVRLFEQKWLTLLGVLCVAGLESAWHFNHFDATQPVAPLIWYVVFLAVFSGYPLLFLRRFGDVAEPWVAAALVGIPQFLLVRRLVAAAWPNSFMGLIPAAFALPPLLSLAVVVRALSSQSAARQTQLAWLGGVALLFITLIFPVQFHREWLTLSWALEGGALLWLFHRVPHRGLQLVGTVLLSVAFVRLSLNQAVLQYHPRSAVPIVNWYFYTYALVTACLFGAARLTVPPRDKIWTLQAPALFLTLGTILAFLLVNIEIADFFSEPGSTLTFQFSGRFDRDMTYSIAWGLFALGLLFAGIRWKTPASRYAALALLSITVLKLFFHDLSTLGQLYRIGAVFGVAVIAILASVAYQRFFTAKDKELASHEPLKPS